MTSPLDPTLPLATPPKAGETLSLPIVSAPMRTTLFPESTPLVSISPDAIEVIFLRNEVVFTAQNGVVVDRSDQGGHVEVEMELAAPTVQMLDLGHVRLPVKLATDLAVNMLSHMSEHHGISLPEVIARLQSE